MGTLTCQRCFATAEGNTQEEADANIDHAIGQMIGRPCSGNNSDLKWTGSQKATTETTPREAPTTETSKSSTKTIKKSKKG